MNAVPVSSSPAPQSGASMHRQSTTEARQTIFEQAAEIVATEYARPLRMGEVAQRLSTSPRHLQRVFSDTGLGFRSYLRRVRMAHALDLLSNSEIPINHVARQVGYSDPGQFSKAFRRTYGVTPSRAREVDALHP